MGSRVEWRVPEPQLAVDVIVQDDPSAYTFLLSHPRQLHGASIQFYLRSRGPLGDGRLSPFKFIKLQHAGSP